MTLRESFRFIDLAPETETFESAVCSGLAMTPKCLPSKFFYDATGSRLFEEICTLPEYYPTRTEMALLARNAANLAHRIGPRAQILEFGAGALDKVRILLRALERPSGFTAVDISGEHLKEAADELAQDFPELPITAVAADYTQPLPLPEPLAASTERRIGFFPGSTIGNFTPEAAEAFLKVIRPIFEPRGLLIIGVDLKKDPAILNAAYNDAAGVTARFNLNLLARINRELGGDFDLGAFRHKAFYNEAEGRIEMHLESLAKQKVHVKDRIFDFVRGETIRTEISCKYSMDEFRTLAAKAGWQGVTCLTDPERLFSIHLLAPNPV
ncbi:MAG: L-histidine N(alpha)-methyltransferase [Rhodothalassiaceae bacterium]